MFKKDDFGGLLLMLTIWVIILATDVVMFHTIGRAIVASMVSEMMIIIAILTISDRFK